MYFSLVETWDGLTSLYLKTNLVDYLRVCHRWWNLNKKSAKLLVS